MQQGTKQAKNETSASCLVIILDIEKGIGQTTGNKDTGGAMAGNTAWTNEQIDQKERELRCRWIVIKLKLTDWLENSLVDIPNAQDYKGIKCIIDATSLLEKMIGSTPSNPTERDIRDDTTRVQAILKKLDISASTGKLSAPRRNAGRPRA